MEENSLHESLSSQKYPFKSFKDIIISIIDEIFFVYNELDCKQNIDLHSSKSV